MSLFLNLKRKHNKKDEQPGRTEFRKAGSTLVSEKQRGIFQSIPDGLSPEEHIEHASTKFLLHDLEAELEPDLIRAIDGA